MAPSSTRSSLVSTETRKKKRRLRSLLNEFQDEASIFLKKYDMVCAKTSVFLENSDAQHFLHEFGSYAAILEECLEKLMDCNLAMTLDDEDGNEESFSVSDKSSVVSGRNGQPIPRLQIPNSSSCAGPVQNNCRPAEECDLETTQCTVLEPIAQCEDKCREEDLKQAEKEPKIVEVAKEQEEDLKQEEKEPEIIVEVAKEREENVKQAGKEPEIVEMAKEEEEEEEEETRMLACVDNSHCEVVSSETREVDAEHVDGKYMGLITCCVNPSEFYFILPGNLNNVDRLNATMNLMDLKPEDAIEMAKLKIGRLYMALSQPGRYWSRVKVILIETNSKVKVKEVDHGKVTTVAVSQLFPVPDELLDVEPLASCCSLYNVEPVGKEWSAECIEEMSWMVRLQPQVSVRALESQEDVLHVELFKVCEHDFGELEVNVGDYMVYRGHARYSDADPVPQSEVEVKQVNEGGNEMLPAGSISSSEWSSYTCSFQVPQVGGKGEGGASAEELDVGVEDLEKAKSDVPCDGNDSDQSMKTRYFGKPDKTITNPKVPCEQYGCFEVTVCHVNNPGDFYVYFQVDEVVQGLESLDVMLKDLRDNLSKKDGEENKKLTFMAGTYCCAQLSSGEWCRCEILEVDPHGSRQADEYSVKVHSLDIGCQEWVNVENVRPMTSDMFHFPAFAVKSSLGLISPVGSVAKACEKESAQWCPEAIRWMKETCASFKLWFVNLLSQSDDETLSLLLFDFNDNCEILINEALCLLGLAASEKFKKPADKENDNKQEDFADCDPMADDYLSERNKIGLDFDDPEMAVMHYKRQDEKTICHFYQRGRPCRKGSSCQFKHVTPAGRVTTDTKEVASVDFNSKDLEGLDVEHVVVTAAYNPGRFYINIFNDANVDNEYVQLFNSMQTYCRKTKEGQSDMTMRALGEMVVAIFGDGFWYRARVVDMNEEYRRLKVFFVDTGASSWVSEKDAKDLPLEFCHCPTQAVCCVYRGLEPVQMDPGVGRGWSNAARTHFVNLVDDKVLQAHVTDRYPDGTLELELYDTNGRVPRFIGDKMVEAGFASRSSES